MLSTLSLLLALAAAPVPSTTSPTPSPAMPTAAQAELDLKSEIDVSVRWLRSVQDPRTGAYGGGVAGTAWTLRALGEGPRRYRAFDGPFVAKALAYLVGRQAEDGSIADEDATQPQRAVQTSYAVGALLLHADDSTRAELARALAYLESVEDAGVGWDAGPEFASSSAALEFVLPLLGARKADGSWDGARGAVIETADAVLALSRAHAVLESGKPAAKARPAQRLPRFDDADRDATLASLERGAKFLVAAAEDGRFGAQGQPDPGITAMVLAALQQVPAPREEALQATIDAGLAWLVELQNEDGSIHAGRLANYTTSAAVLALVAADRDELSPVIARARDFLLTLQADEGEGYSEGDLFYGGIGYGGDERPDLSNLQMALEALAAAGLEPGDEAFRKAQVFLDRCQNRSESNDVRLVSDEFVVVSGDDGGAGYMPGDSKAGFAELADGTRVPRSYGSMTYALLKCHVLAGVPKDDPRMQAAWDWCRENYTLDVNPGFEATSDPRAAYQGLFYYFYTLAKALDAYGEAELVDANGDAHAWRREVSGRLISIQDRADGSWVNENSPRWWEGNPVLATAYAMLTLGAALPSAD